MASTIPTSYYESVAQRGVSVSAHDAPQPWTPEEVPPLPGGSRFALPYAPNGNDSTPAKVSTNIYANLLTRFQKALKPAAPEFAEFVVKRVAQVSLAPEYELKLVERFRGIPVFVPPPRDGKFKSVRQSVSGELLDALFLGELDPWAATDDQVWESALEHAKATRADGRTCSQLSQVVATFLGARHGLDYPAASRMPG
jgi:hypothetical protein